MTVYFLYSECQFAASKTLKDIRKTVRKAVKAKGIKPKQIAAIVREGRR